MPLSDVYEKLYKKKAPENLSRHETSEYDATSPEVGIEKPKISAEDLWKKKEGLSRPEKKILKKGIIALSVILFLVVALLVVIAIRNMSFSESGTVVAISGPEQAPSGKLVTHEITYKNENWADINNAVLTLSYSENLKPDDNAGFISDSPTSGHYDLNSIKGKRGGKVVFNSKSYSPKGALIYIKAELKYQPQNSSTIYAAEDKIGINIISSPIILEIQAPQNVSSGDEVNYLVSYKNDGAENLENLKIKLDYPDQFNFSGSDPKVFENNNIWYIGTLSAGQDGKIVVSGKLEGERDQVKIVEAHIGTDNGGQLMSYNDERAETKIVASPLAISQTVNGFGDLKVNAGDILNFTINFKNNGTIGLGDVIVREKLDSPVLDYSSLKMSGGSFDYDTKTIIWKASDFSNLKNFEPGQNGMIKFSIKVKSKISVENSNDKNFVISSVAKIDSPDIPTPISMNKIISGNKMDIKLNTKLILDVKGFHLDPNIGNSGPIPPKAGEETTYVIHWIVANVSNDITDARVEAVLPTNAQMTGAVFPEGAHIEYNERTNSIAWTIGNISAGTGILSNPQEASFQVRIKPSPDQVGKEAGLLGESKFTAHDTFTGENLQVSTGKKNTNLTEDNTIGEGFRVVQ